MGEETILKRTRLLLKGGSRNLPVIEQGPLPVVKVKGPHHELAYINPAFCRLLGKPRAELLGKRFEEIVPGGKECVAVLDRVLQTGEPVAIEQELDDEWPPSEWLYAMWPALDSNERTEGVIIQLAKADSFRQNAAAINEALLLSSLRQHELTASAVTLNAQLEKEIAERKSAEAALREANQRLGNQAAELEDLVAKRTEKLRETVADLETFSYSVAHDLRAPLRSMEGLARILLAEHSGQLNPHALSQLERISVSAARMNRLIQDVLNYSQVLREPAPLRSVNLNQLIPDLIATYPGWQPPTAEIQIVGKLASVWGHEGLLTQCISNLLSNAVKFVAPGVIPHVRIWTEITTSSVPTASPDRDRGDGPRAAEATGPNVRVFFENNGIGIATKDRGRVFRMFDRINPAAHFEGTGIGLVIARRAVERMRGRIDFEPAPSGGSRFWIELTPAKDSSKDETSSPSDGPHHIPS